ncbi:sodium/proline symporter, partial [bacterium]|nr:sodium/proline symporter [bacterium]
SLVILAWSALACTLGPLVIIHALGKRPSENLALLMMLVGFVVAIGWRQLGWNKQLYEGAPGILFALLIYFIATRLTGSKDVANETLDYKSP